MLCLEEQLLKFVSHLMPKEAFLSLIWSLIVPTFFPSLHTHPLWDVKRGLRAKCYTMNGKSLPHACAAVDSLILFFLLCYRSQGGNCLSWMMGSSFKEPYTQWGHGSDL